MFLPVARLEHMHLLGFRDSKPSRQIAMVWRKSSAMGDFLQKPAQVFRELPAELFTPTADLAMVAKKRPPKRGPERRSR